MDDCHLMHGPGGQLPVPSHRLPPPPLPLDYDERDAPYIPFNRTPKRRNIHINLG